MMKAILVTAVGVLAAIPLMATQAVFSFTGADGNPVCSTCGSGTVTAQGGTQVFSDAESNDTATLTAWVASYSGGNLSTADVGYYSGAGSGICEGGASCNSPYHQVDNDSEYEIMQITFQTAVDISSITLGNYGKGSDETQTNMSSTLWASNSQTLSTGSTLTVSSTTLSGFGSGDSSTCTDITGAANCSSNGQSRSGTVDTISLGSNSNFSDVKTLLVAAKIGDTDSTGADFFKIQAVNASLATGNVSTPEPATFGMLGLALAGLGLFGRRRGRNS